MQLEYSEIASQEYVDVRVREGDWVEEGSECHQFILFRARGLDEFSK